MAILQKRDYEVLDIMANFGGKTFRAVLAETAFRGLKNADQQAANRIQKLKKSMKIFKFMETGLNKHKYALSFSGKGVELMRDMGYNIANKSVMSPQSINHMILEQITFYYLKKMGKKVKRTVVAKWGKEHAHTPDLMYELDNGGKVYVEIELNKKSPERYTDTFIKMRKDGVKSVLYVFENEKRMRQIGRILPVWDKLYYITKDQLIECYENGEKLKATKQKDFLLELNEKENKDEK